MNRIRVAFANRDFAIDDTVLAFPTDDRGAWIAGLASLPAGADSAAAPTSPAAPAPTPVLGTGRRDAYETKKKTQPDSIPLHSAELPRFRT